jgi:hypothetical protein
LGQDFGARQGVVGANANSSDSPAWHLVSGALDRLVSTTSRPNGFQLGLSYQSQAVETAGQAVTGSFKEGFVDSCGLDSRHGEQQGEIGLHRTFSDCCSRQVRVIDQLHIFCLEPRPLSAAKFLPEFLGFVRNEEMAVSVVHLHHGSDIVDIQKEKDVLQDVVVLTGETHGLDEECQMSEFILEK